MFRVALTIAIFWFATSICGQNSQTHGKIPSSSSSVPRSNKAREVLKYMNLKADPCHDFYDFACGNWAKCNEAKYRGELLTTQSILAERVSEELQRILEGKMGTRNAANDQKIRTFYADCKGTPQNVEFLVKLVRENKGLPAIASTEWDKDYNWVKVIALLRQRYNLDILIGVEIEGRNMYLTEPKATLLPAELCSAMATQQMSLNDEAYENIQKEISKDMQVWFNLREPEANRFAGDIVSFEFDLCRFMRTEHSIQESTIESDYKNGRQNGVYNMKLPQKSFAEFSEEFKPINFADFMDMYIPSRMGDKVTMQSVPYFQHLSKIIAKTQKPTIANYIIYRALVAFKIPEITSRRERVQFCVELVMKYFPRIVGEMYNHNYRKDIIEDDVEHIFENSVKAFDQALDIEWMQDSSRRTIRTNLKHYKLKLPSYHSNDLIGGPTLADGVNFWRQLETLMQQTARNELEKRMLRNYNAEEEGVEAPEISAKLVLSKSEIHIGWGLLKPPVYDSYYPNSLKYSSVGQKLARELAKAFDEENWIHRDSTDYVRNLQNQSQCFLKQYSNYLYNNPDTFRNASQLRDIIADSCGLNIAFTAYLLWLKDPMQREQLFTETLPGVNFTNTQLFFINFAQTRCFAKYNEQTPPEFLPLDKHTAERYAVNGPLSNNKEFAREFGCAIGSEMNIGDKCQVF